MKLAGPLWVDEPEEYLQGIDQMNYDVYCARARKFKPLINVGHLRFKMRVYRAKQHLSEIWNMYRWPLIVALVAVIFAVMHFLWED